MKGGKPATVVFTYDQKPFDKMLTELMRYTGKSFASVVKHEAARVLEQSIKRTGAATGKSIDARYTYKDDGTDSSKRVGYVTVKGKRVRVGSQHKKGAYKSRGRGGNRKRIWVPGASNPTWRPLQTELKRLKAHAKARRGMSKASWWHVARRAKLYGAGVGGKQIFMPKFVKKAYSLMSSNMKAKISGRGTEEGKREWVIVMKNYAAVPMIRSGKRGGADARAAFKYSYHARVSYFKTNMSKGVYKKTARIAKKYPGLKLTPIRNAKGNN